MLEPWLRGTLGEYDAVRRQVLHALELAEEDCLNWCADLSDPEANLRPYGMASVAYHLRHIARSLDRLLTYAQAESLSEAQMDALRRESEPGATVAGVLDEFRAGVASAKGRVAALDPAGFDTPREVGRQRLPTTLGGLVVHCAEHTQRHVGQVISTVQVVRGWRREQQKATA